MVKKLASGLQKKIESRGHTTMIVDPMELDLPILDRMYKEMKNPEPKFQKLRE